MAMTSQLLLLPLMLMLLLAPPCGAQDYATFQLTDIVLQPVPVSPRMVGFSIEVSSAQTMLAVGGRGGPARNSFSNLMNLLRGSSEMGPHLRIGGNSADSSVYVPGDAPLPAGDTYRILDADFATYAAAVPLFNGSVTLDVNFRDATNHTLGALHVANAQLQLGGLLESVEIGNEPDLYSRSMRPSSYAYADYKSEWDGYSTALGDVMQPSTKLQGATWCQDAVWPLVDWDDYVTSFSPRLSSLSFHRYPESGCSGKNGTIPRLLNDSSSAGIAAFMKPRVDAGAAAGIPVFVGEGNSVSCGGTAGVSNVFAAALWAVDSLFSVAAVGVRRWNFHGGPKGMYPAIAYEDTSKDEPEVRPLFYGLWAFANATGGGGVIHEVEVVVRNNDYIKCWSVVDSRGVHRVVVIHKDFREGALNASITIVPPSRGLTGQATLERLDPGPLGALATASDRITFAGQTLRGTPDGLPVGTRVTTRLSPNGGGDYALLLPPASVAVLTLPSQ